MTLARAAAAGALALLAASCTGIRVESELDDAADLGAYERYAWSSPPAPLGDDRPLGLDVDDERIVVTGVDAALARRGLARIDDDLDADLRLRYLVQVAERVQFNDPYFSHDLETTYEEGALIVDAVDLDTGRRVWRGVARARLREDADAEERTERVERAVEALMERCPLGR